MTLKEAAGRLNVPESTLRLWRNEFESYLPMRGEGRRRRLEGESLELLRVIVDGKRAGWSAPRILDELRKRHPPEEKKRQKTQAEAIEEMHWLLKGLGENLERLRAEVAASREELSRLRAALEESAAPSLEELLIATQGETAGRR